MDVDDFERLVDALLEAGVFDRSDGGRLRLADSFERRREECRSTVAALDDEAFAARLAEYADDPSPGDVAPEVLGDAVAIFETAETIDRERSLVAAHALDRVDLAGQEQGVPDGFVPVAPGEIDGFVDRHPAAILYFWREDCDPCDDVRAELERMVAEGEIPEEVGLGAVYGPDDPDLLRREYDVGMAPTVLFCEHGRVGSRLVGELVPGSLRAETSTMLDVADLE